jgi:hypothetical protein
MDEKDDEYRVERGGGGGGREQEERIEAGLPELQPEETHSSERSGSVDRLFCV